MLPPKEFKEWMDRLCEAHRSSWQYQHELRVAERNRELRAMGCAARMGLSTPEECLCWRPGCTGSARFRAAFYAKDYA